MASNPTDEILYNFLPYFRIFKDGRIQRLHQPTIVPPSDDPQTGVVRSKDVSISPENKVGARLFIPNSINSDRKLPVLIYIHGGAFAIESAFSSTYHNYVSSVVEEAQVIAVSIDYRLAPEHPIPACYDDSWEVMKWVTSHHAGNGPEPWLNNHGDFTRLFVAGDSAGGNISHNVVARASARDGLEEGVKLMGMILIHPFFGSGEPKGGELWEYLCADPKGCDDPRLCPMAHPDTLSGLVCSKVLIFTAEKDFIRENGRLYYESLKKSGFGGEVETLESEGEGHVFHLVKPICENAGILMKLVVAFLND